MSDDAQKPHAAPAAHEGAPPGEQGVTAKPSPGGKPHVGMWIGAGIGAGIGSAAVAAALLYATRTKKPKSPAKD